MSDTLSENKETVLFVDDEKHILSSLRRLMRPLKLNLHFANSGAEGLELLKEHHVDLIVSDMRMPHMDGAEFLTKSRTIQPECVRILLTGYADMQSTIDALNHGGIYRHISKPWNDDELRDVIQEGLKLKRLERERDELIGITKKQNEELSDLNKNLEAKVEARTSEVIQASQMLDIAYQELQSSYDSFVEVFSNFVNTRPTMQKAESKLVGELSKDMATLLKLKPKSVNRIYHAGLLHQLGKMSFPDELLDKAEDSMSKAEFDSYKKYPLIGETALSAINSFEKTAMLIRSHTEYYDGSGFPDKLKGSETLAGARIIRVARDYIGMQTGIVQKLKLKAEPAFNAISKEAEKKYDPIVVKALSKLYQKYDIAELYADEIQIDSMRLMPGMKLTKDLVTSKGMLLISKGHVINDTIIAKIIALEKKEKETFVVFVAKEKQNKSVLDEGTDP